jgi:FKBP-type peptidyl-prolyl cis-trans isomerase FklB
VYLKKITMKKIFFGTSLVLLTLTANAQPTSKKTDTKKPEVKQSLVLKNQLDTVSYLIGRILGENVLRDLSNANKELVIQGITDRLKDQPVLCEDPQNKIISAYFQKIEAEKQAVAAKDGLKAREEGIMFLNNNKSKPNIQTTSTGLQYEVILLGKGEKPKASDQVTVHYHGTTTEGKVFDSSVDRGEPATFGLSQVIKGWTEGLQLMPVGSKFKFYIPQELAYGEQSPSPAIKPYSVLIFEVELIKIN